MRRKAYTLIAVVVLLLSAAGAAVLAQKKDDKKEQAKLDEAQRQEVQALLTAVDNVATGQAAPTGYPIKWEQAHFIKAQASRTYVPFTVTIDPASVTSPAVSLYLRVVDKKAATAEPPPANDKDKDKDQDKKKDAKNPPREYAFEAIHSVDLAKPEGGAPIRLSRAFSVPPGEYDVYVALKERAPAGQKPDKNAPPAKMGIVKETLTVPNYWAEELTTSSVILAAKAEPLGATQLTPEQQADNPYAIGGAKFTPSLDGKFSKKGELNVVFWVYNPAVDQAKKPDVTIEYNFHQKTGETEKYFNKTEPQQLSASTLPPQFDFAAGHQLPGSLTIPLDKFPEGDFRLEIKITDNITKKTLTRDVKFSVTS